MITLVTHYDLYLSNHSDLITDSLAQTIATLRLHAALFLVAYRIGFYAYAELGYLAHVPTETMKAAKLLIPRCPVKPQKQLHTEYS